MIRYLRRSLASYLCSGRTLFVLSALGVSLGVAAVVAIQVINLNALGAFEGSVRAVGGESDLTVRGRAPDFDESLFAEVLAQPGVAAAWPLYRLTAVLDTGEPGPEVFVDVVGFDLFSPARIPWSGDRGGLADPLTVAGWTAVSPELARRFGWGIGSGFRVSSGSRRIELRVGALVDFRRVTPLAGTRLLVMDISQAQSLFGERGRIHQIEIRLADSAETARVRDELAERLGPGLRVETPQQRRQQAAGLLGAFRLNLTALSLISLFVGVFLVYVTTRASLLRRRHEFGLLRSLGATRTQTLSLMLAEVAMLGALGTALGLPLGYLTAALNVDRVSGTLSNLYLLEEIETLRLPAWIYLLGAAIGIGGSVAGALLPALDVSRRSPRSLLAAYAVRERLSRGAPLLFGVGLGVVLLGSLGSLGPVFDWRPGGFLAAIGLLIGLPLMTPLTVRALTGALPVRGFGVRTGVKALGLDLGTTAFAIAAMGVAVSMLVGITLMIGSFRRTVEIWIEDTLHADVYVSTESWARGREAAVMEEPVVRSLGDHPAVRRVDRLRQFFTEVGGVEIPVTGVDMELALETSRFAMLWGERDAALRAARDRGAVIIGEPLARKQNLRPGDTLEVFGPRGSVTLEVAAVAYDYSNERGGVVMDLGAMERAFGPGPINNVALYLRPGADTARVVDELRAARADLPLRIRSNRELRREIFDIFDQTFAVTRLLQAMSLLIAACGITLTLIVLARERVAELALYRALGATRAQIARVFLGKGIGMALLGMLLGAFGGLALAMVLIFLINRAYFGWTIAMHWPWPELAQQAATILLAALAASAYPALRASGAPATELTRENL